jgi:uncharacterized protein YegJ (DUF2314 family)
MTGKKREALAVATTLLATKFPVWKAANELPKEPQEMLVRIHPEGDVAKDHVVPDADSLRYRGHGLSKEQEVALQKTTQALILDFAFPKKDVWRALRSANEFVEELAHQTGGLVWDEETRAIFSSEAWHKIRLDGWQGVVPSMKSQITIDAYENGEFIREISMGMKKVGLPDVVVEEVPRVSDALAGSLINLVAQSMAEGHLAETNRTYKVDIQAIQNANFRESLLKTLKPNATKVACLNIWRGVPEKGDPNNELIEIGFDRYAGADMHEKEAAAFSWLFGWEDSVKHIRHTHELLAESQKERGNLPKLERDFAVGLKPGESIALKAPFQTPDGGTEYMWVEVQRWKNGKIKGVLIDDPEYVPSLHDGAIVEIKEAEVFDYVRHFPDGHDEGNTTGAMIEKMQGDEPPPSNASLVPPPICSD